VNPDEVVAVGAAVQAGVIGGEVTDILLLDVTPLTLGLETLGGVRTPLIQRNTTVPTSKSQVFSTAADNQTGVEIHVLQGEREMASDNKSLGRFHLDGIPPAPRGVPQIEVVFDIDANGILHVTAKDKTSGKEQKITITNSTNISEEEVNRMKSEAEKHASEDKAKKESVEARNKASGAAFELEKQLREHGAKLPDDDRKNIEEKTKALKELSEKPEATKEQLEKATEEAFVAAQKIGEILMKEQQEKSAGATTNTGDSSDNKTESNPGAEKGKAEEGEVVS